MKWWIYKNPITGWWTVRDAHIQTIYLFPTGAAAHAAFNNGNTGR